MSDESGEPELSRALCGSVRLCARVSGMLTSASEFPAVEGKAKAHKKIINESD